MTRIAFNRDGKAPALPDFRQSGRIVTVEAQTRTIATETSWPSTVITCR